MYKVERLISRADMARETVFEHISLIDFQDWFKNKYNSKAMAYQGMRQGVYRPHDKKGNCLDVIYLTMN